MKYIWLKEVDSTQKELKRVLKNIAGADFGTQTKLAFSAQNISKSKAQTDTDSSAHATLESTPKSTPKSKEVCIIADIQTAGIGSRGSVWENALDSLMFSFTFLAPPKDLPKQSVALYLGFVFKEVLCSLGSSAWLKYPNDLYVGEDKIGGILVSIYQNHLLCGIGLNLKSAKFGSLDICPSKREILEKFFKILQKPPTWKQIFSKYKLEFHRNFSFCFHYQGKQISLRDSILREDGALEVRGEVIYNLGR